MRSPECPRCSYDLSGKLESYRESCPLEDMCSECGCEYRWRSIFGELIYPRWFVESQRSKWGWRILPTLARCAHAPSFWRAALMEYPLLAGRAFAVVLAGYFVLVAVVAIARFPSSRIYRHDAVDNILWIAGNAVWPWGSINAHSGRPPLFFDLSFEYGIVPPVVIPVVAGIVTPILFVVPVFTREAYGIRKLHIMRIALYGFTGLFMVAMTSLLIDVWVEPNLFPGWYAYDEVWNPVIRGAPILLTLLWQLWWWISATRHYLRIDAAWGFAAPLVLASTLAGVVGLYVLALLYQPATRYGFGMAF